MSQGTTPPAMFSPSAPAIGKALVTPERGVENVTPPTAVAGTSPFVGTATKPLASGVDAVKPTPQPGLFKPDAGIGGAKPAAAAATSHPQVSFCFPQIHVTNSL